MTDEVFCYKITDWWSMIECDIYLNLIFHPSRAHRTHTLPFWSVQIDLNRFHHKMGDTHTTSNIKQLDLMSTRLCLFQVRNIYLVASAKKPYIKSMRVRAHAFLSDTVQETPSDSMLDGSSCTIVWENNWIVFLWSLFPQCTTHQ